MKISIAGKNAQKFPQKSLKKTFKISVVEKKHSELDPPLLSEIQIFQEMDMEEKKATG